jgi:hypothetical protein
MTPTTSGSGGYASGGRGGGCSAGSAGTDDDGGGGSTGGGGTLTEGGAGTSFDANNDAPVLDTSPTDGSAETTCAGPPATCSTPPGLVEPFSTIDRVYAWVTGKWLFCTGRANWQGAAPSDAIGVEFTPGSSAPTARGSTVGGNMYYLVQGPSGPVRGSGCNYQLTYDISPEGTSYQFNVHPDPNSGFVLRLKYSACPRELDAFVDYATTDSVLVPTN